MAIKIVNPERHRGQYTAKLERDGQIVGRVERGFTQGGLAAGDYKAQVDGLIVATGRTLAGLREELREWEAAE